VQGNEITLKYKEGEKKIVVGPETVIVTYVPGDKSELKPGSKIFIAAANKKDDGTLEAAAVSVGRDGITPPLQVREPRAGLFDACRSLVTARSHFSEEQHG